MKTLLVILTGALLTLPLTGHSSELAPSKTITLTTKPVDLSINNPSAHFVVNYPGLGTMAVCALDLKLSLANFARAQDLNDVLIVEETFDHEIVPLEPLDSKIATIELKRGLYVTGISISTRDGRNLREALRDMGIFKGNLQLAGRGCP
ncbi:hypothetical protein CIK05_09610 [Bdellovibrio sp. qaytius]|nr:hypothetical protein CIK05_09610 [Bdellovibrio sp. qaytius]